MPTRSPSSTALLVMLLATACSGDGAGAVVDAADPDAATDDAGPDAALDAAVDAAPDAAAPPVPVPLFLELGHQTGLTSLQRTATRALSVDAGGHWALWDLGARALIAKGDRACPVSQACQQPAALLADDTVLVRGMPDLEVRSAATGAVLATITTTAALDTPGSGVADDGSYVWAATTTSLRAWTPAGFPKVNVAGNYLVSQVHAAPTELRIGAGPAGVDRIERVAVANGARTTSLHDGTFARWFHDGARFLTTSGNLVRVYAATGAAVSATVLPAVTDLDAEADRVWIRTRDNFNDVLNVYRASDLTAAPTLIPIPLSAEIIAAPGAVGVLHPTYGSFDAVALVTLAVTHVDGLPCGLGAFGAGAAGGWMVGTGAGAVLTGSGAALDPPLARGKLTSVSGTVGGLAAVASAAGIIELVEVDDTPMVVRTLPYLASHVELSTDGATLVATEDLPNGSCRPALPLRVIATATGAVLHQWPYPGLGDAGLLEVSVARTALTLAHYQFVGGALTKILTTATGVVLPSYGPPLTSDLQGIGGLLLFAPGGQRAASLASYATIDQAFTYLYDAGVQRAIIDGVPLGWLDDDRLLVARYARAGNQYVLMSTTVRAPDGAVVATLPLPDLAITGSLSARVRGQVTPVGQGQLYARRKNAVYDPATGAQVWAGPFNAQGDAATDAAGDHVLYVSGTAIQVARFRP